MRFAAQQRSCDEVETGALGRVAKNSAIKEVDGKQMELRARERTDLGSFRDADEGTAEAESIRKNGDNERKSQSEESRSRHGCEKRIRAVAPESLAYA
jgi:hypothetical protein